MGSILLIVSFLGLNSEMSDLPSFDLQKFSVFIQSLKMVKLNKKFFKFNIKLQKYLWNLLTKLLNSKASGCKIR